MTRALLALLWAGCARAEPAEPEATSSAAAPPAPTVDVAPDAPLVDADCERCHVADAASWRASAHRTAFADEVFQAEWSPTRQPACVTCHAPLADPARPEGEAAALGVSCVVCHGSGPVRAVHAADGAPHAVLVDPTLASVDACAHCHDFTFAAVAPTPHDLDASLQRTVTEWHEVEERGTCQRCHMRDGERVSHAMPGARSSLLSDALEVRAAAERDGDSTRVTLTLTSRAGHAVPTGDVYRRLVIEAWPDGRGSPSRAVASATLMRRFERDGSIEREVLDDRVPPREARTVELVLRRARRVRWRITWQALEPGLAEHRWIPEDVAARVVAEGTTDVH